MLIENKNTKIEIAPNFILSEFFGGETFEMPDALVKAAQILRDWSKQPVTITSTYRPTDTFGYHRFGRACDYVATKKSQKFNFIDSFYFETMSWVNGRGSQLIEDLRKAGITGFGLENVCVHLDTRSESKCNRTDVFGKYLAFVYKQSIENGNVVIEKNYAI